MSGTILNRSSWVGTEFGEVPYRRTASHIALGFPRPSRQKAGVKLTGRLPLTLAALASLAIGGAVWAQLEGADRGVPPIDCASTF